MPKINALGSPWTARGGNLAVSFHDDQCEKHVGMMPPRRKKHTYMVVLFFRAPCVIAMEYNIIES